MAMAVKLFVLIFGMSEREKLFTMMAGENSCQGICCVILARAAPQVNHFLVSNVDAQLSILLPTCAESGIKNRGLHKNKNEHVIGQICCLVLSELTQNSVETYLL